MNRSTSKDKRVIVFRGGLSERIFVATRWVEYEDGKMLAIDKFDITEQLEQLLQRWSPTRWDVSEKAVMKSTTDELMLGRVTKRTARMRAANIVDRFHANRWRVRL